MFERPFHIAYPTGSRADFGLMRPVLDALGAHPAFRLSVHILGEHFSSEMGETVCGVEESFPDAVRLESAAIRGDAPFDVAWFLGDAVRACAMAWSASPPDLALLLGDRPEMLAAAGACLYLGVPVAHVHGGDVSGTADDGARRAIAQLAALHLPATSGAAERLVAQGIPRERIHVVGSPAMDAVRLAAYVAEADIRGRYPLPDGPVALVTLHPDSGRLGRIDADVAAVLDGLAPSGLAPVVVHPHRDAGGLEMAAAFRRRLEGRSHALLPSVPLVDFVAMQRFAAVWVGNSSAGLIESGATRVPVVDVGGRQAGREHGDNVAHAPFDAGAISEAVRDRLAWDRATAGPSPWGDGWTAARAVSVLAEFLFGRRT